MGTRSIFLYVFPLSDNEYNIDGYCGVPNQALTQLYGQYDNGPKVFDFYNNFNGTSLCTCLSAEAILGNGNPGGNTIYIISDGLRINTSGAEGGWGYGYHIYLNSPQTFSTFDTNVLYTNAPTVVPSEGVYLFNSIDTIVPNPNYIDDHRFYSVYSSEDLVDGFGDNLSLHLVSGGEGTNLATEPFIGWRGFSTVWPSTGAEYSNYNEVQQLSGTDRTITYGQSYPDIVFINGEVTQYSMTFEWMRTRNAAPNNVMPGVIFGTPMAY